MSVDIFQREKVSQVICYLSLRWEETPSLSFSAGPWSQCRAAAGVRRGGGGTAGRGKGLKTRQRWLPPGAGDGGNATELSP